jgi:endonuclease/exonuclease/phosphatase (EEP) superfamily protein YafD
MAEVLADQADEAARVSARADLMGPVLIAGDFNNGPLDHSPMFASLTDAAFTDALGSAVSRGPTSRGGRHPIDWIFVKGVAPVRGRGRVIDAQAASDHSPVLAALTAATAVALVR